MYLDTQSNEMLGRDRYCPSTCRQSESINLC